MAQIRGTAGYNLGGPQHHFSAPGRPDGADSNTSPLDAIREQTSKIEDWLDTISDPVKPYVNVYLPTTYELTCFVPCAYCGGPKLYG